MLDNTNPGELMDRTQAESGLRDTNDVSQAPSTAAGRLALQESLYIDDRGAVVARNVKFGDEPDDERMDILVLERADGRPVLEISSMVPEHFAGTHVAPKTQIAQYAPDTEDFSVLAFGDELDPAAISLASVRPGRGAGAIRVSSDEVGLVVKTDSTEAGLRLYADRCEADVPFKFATPATAPANPQVGWAYFDFSEKALKVWAGDDWIILQ